MARSLVFAPPQTLDMAKAALAMLPEGRQCIRIRPWNSFGQAVAAEILRQRPGTVFAPGTTPRAKAGEKATLDILAEGDADELSRLLLEYLDVTDVRILAPITARHFQNTPLFLIAIPKAGTHLLSQLVKAFGYAPGHLLAFPPKPGTWYYLEHATSHTGAREFLNYRTFSDPFHPFLWTPSIFIYRNPLDIKAREKQPLHQPGPS